MSSRDDQTRPERPGLAPDRALQDNYATAPVAAAPAPPASPPSALPDRYTNLREIARGGMGRVIEAHDRVLRRDVAIKLVLASDAEALQRFAREMRITARLEHPSIVAIHDAGVAADGAPYYVMRKVNGRPLDKLIAEARTVRDRLALVPLVARASRAVAHAHERGIIHRDLKPPNILVAPTGETVVIDWGLAKIVGEPDDAAASYSADPGASLQTRVGTVFGTPGFMSPEQLQSADVDARADVYALGATLYHLLVGQPPHASASGTAMMEAALAAAPPPIGSVVAGIPRPLAAIVDRALSYDLAVRYRDAAALATELERLGAARRGRRGLAIAGVGLVVAGGVAVAAVVGRDEPRAEPAPAPVTTSANDDLVFEKARLLAETQPIAAIAMLRPFASGPRWRDVRAILARAASRGVPWRLGPAASLTALAPDGMTLAAVSDDRVVLYNLVERTSRTLTTLTGGTLGLVFAGTQLVAYGATELQRIDLASGAMTSVVLPALGGRVTMVAHEQTVYIVGGDGSAWRLDADATSPTRLAISDPVTTAAVSADGAVAFGGERSLWVYEDGAAVRLAGTVKNVRSITWQQARPPRFVAAADAWTYGSKIGGAWEMKASIDPTVPAIAITKGGAAFEGHVAYTLDNVHGLRMGGRPIASLKAADYDAPSPVFALGGQVAVVMLDAIWVTGRDSHVELPRMKGCTYMGGRAVQLLAAQCPDGVFVWDLVNVLPAAWRVKYSARLVPTVGSTVAALGPTSIVNDVDVATGAFTLWEGSASEHKHDYTRVRSVAPGGGYMIAQRSGQMYTLLRRTGAAKAYGPEAIQVDAIDDRRLAIATTNGEVLIEDVATGEAKPLYKHPRGLVWMSARPGWVAVASPDRAIVRIDLASGAQTTTTSGDSPSKLAADGSVYWGDAAKLVRWRADGIVETVATLPSEIGTVVIVDGHGVIARLTAGSAYYVTGTRVIPLGDSAPTTVSVAGELGVLTYVDEREATTARMFDAATGQTWPISAEISGTLRLTADGRWLVGESVFNEIQVWPNDIPTTQNAMVPWVERLTNADFDPVTATVSWR